jgi:hypothetical protein
MTHIDKQPSPPHIEPELERRVLRAFAPLNARALGLSLGIVAALAISALTELSIIVDKDREFPLHLLRNYFPGYSVSVAGILVGAVWAFVAGFMFGWLMATIRNVVIGAWILKAKMRADIEASRDVLDQF